MLSLFTESFEGNVVFKPSRRLWQPDFVTTVVVFVSFRVFRFAYVLCRVHPHTLVCSANIDLAVKKKYHEIIRSLKRKILKFCLNLLGFLDLYVL